MLPNLNQVKYFLRHFLSASRKGHGIHSPFAWQLCEEVFYNPNPYYDFEELNDLRHQLLRTGSAEMITVEDLGAGSRRFRKASRSISQIVKNGISSRKQSEILYRLCYFLKCGTIIEMGTSIGLNTIYLSRSNKSAKVYTLEGSGSLISFAQKLVASNGGDNVEFIAGRFSETLPALLEKLKSFDLLYIDGDHRFQSTLDYFYLAINYANNDSVIILDDIYWSNGMTRAWNEIKKHPRVRLSIDTFYFGMVFLRDEIKEPLHLRLWK
jgi:predicted O-methyltransferase YrrM